MGRLASPMEEFSLSLGLELKPWTIKMPRPGGVQKKKHKSVCLPGYLPLSTEGSNLPYG